MDIYSRKVKVKTEAPVAHQSRDETSLSHFLKKYLRPILLGSGLVLVLTAIFSIGGFIKHSGQKKQSDMVYFALKENGGAVSGLEAVEALKEHYLKKGAGPGAVKVASLFYHAGKDDDSLSLYSNIFENGEHNILKSIGLLGLGYSLEAKGRFLEAIAKFNEAKAMTILKDYQYIAAVSVARCYEELNETQKALEEYNLIKEEFEQVEDKAFIEARINALRL